MSVYAAYEGMGLPVYIIGLDSYEIIYINAQGKALFGDVTGQKCYETLNGREDACAHCVPSDILERDGYCHTRLRHLEAAQKYIEIYENIVTLPDGIKGRLCVVVDITAREMIRLENEAREKTRRDMQYLIDMQSGFIRSATSMMSAATMNGEMIFANETMSKTLGYTQEEILAMKIQDFHPPEVLSRVQEKYIPQALTEGMWKGDCPVLKKDGTSIIVRQSVFPIRNDAGEIIATAAIMDDITKERELERMHRYQLAIMNSSTNYIGVSDLEGNTMYHSPGAYRMLGYEAGEIDEWDKKVSHPDWYLKRVQSEGIPTAMREGQWIGRGEIIDRYNRNIPIEQTIFPVYDDNHEHMGVATIITDITEKLQQEKEIEEARRILRTIIDTVPSAIFWKDKDSKYLGVNKKFAADAGIDDPDKLIGMSDFDLHPKHIAERFVETDREIFTTGAEQFYQEVRQPNADGENRWVSVSKVLMRDDKNEPFALLGIYDNITKIKQNEQKLEAAMKTAENASRAQSDFLSRMSHEIRTPMNAIKGLAELLALTELSSIQDSYIRNIVKSGNLLLSIINDVLDFSKINENKIEFVEGPYLLEELVAGVCNVVNLRAAEKELMLIMDISPTLPRELIGDEVRVKQIIINILNNAVKYTPAGHVIMRLYGEETETGIELVCSIEDTGIGIREEDIPFLFEAFSQADRRINHNIQGTGLGLSISDRLVRSMGGNITVESEYGVGSTFTVRLPQRVENREQIAKIENPDDKHVLLLERNTPYRPIARMLDGLGISYNAMEQEGAIPADTEQHFTHCIYDSSFSDAYIRRLSARIPDCVYIAVKDIKYAMGQSELSDGVLFFPLLVTEVVKMLAMTPGQHARESAAERRIDNFALKNTQVLVVDDNEINLIVGGEILRAYKAEVTCAESGREALDLCEAMQFDLIFMDHMMPEMDGVETTLALREGSSRNKATPVIALTANVVNDMASYYLQNGMDDFIGKPIELGELRRVLLRWLPAEKITGMTEALAPEAPPNSDAAAEYSMERLIESLDTFGMYVSDVMGEIGYDYELYINRLDRIRNELSPLVARLREYVRDEDWGAFTTGIDELGSMIHDVGARDCSGRARQLSNASKERNAEYIRSDFFSLMDNMYMLEKKMEVAVPLAQGSISPDVPFGDLGYCRDRLLDMTRALSEQDYVTCEALLDSLAHYSLDHALDLILVAVGARFFERDYEAMPELLEQALSHCDGLLADMNQGV